MTEPALGKEEVGRILSATAEEVLETMFFTGMGGPAAPPTEPGLAALVRFLGTPSGVCGVWIGESAAREMAASFLGVEIGELDPADVIRVASELSNMICGSVVSRLESSARIELEPPRMVPSADFFEQCTGDGAESWCEIEHGTLGLMLRLEESA